METTFGTLDPPLGKVRLNIAGLICTAVSTNTKIINDAVASTGILSILLVSLLSLLLLMMEFGFDNILDRIVSP